MPKVISIRIALFWGAIHTVSLSFMGSPACAQSNHVSVIDFDAALHSVQIDPDADSNGIEGENGIPDGREMALLSAVLQDTSLDLSATNGISHQRVYQAYQHALRSARIDLAQLLDEWPSADHVVAAFSILGNASHRAIHNVTNNFSAPLKGDYTKALALAPYLAAEGDADGDGFTNRQEYYASRKEGRAGYVRMALNPELTPTAEQLSDMKPLKKTRYTLGIVLFPGFEVLDVFGPLEIWSYVPNFEVVLIAETAGLVQSAQGVSVEATYAFSNAPTLDIVMVPGGNGTMKALSNPTLLDYLKQVHAGTTYTTSVCTGSALLAKAGILAGHRATTNKRFFFLSELQAASYNPTEGLSKQQSLSKQQKRPVNWVDNARWVKSGKIFTSSGVSAGTDMALALVAEIYDSVTARELASSVEYEWHEDATNDPFSQFVNRLVAPSPGSMKQLVKSTPSANSHLAESPRFLHLIFSEAPTVKHSDISLYSINHREQAIPLSSLHSMQANDLMISVSDTLAKGKYLVEWKTAFENSQEILKGYFHFTVN